MNENRFGFVVLTVILSLFLVFFFYIAYRLSPSIVSQLKGIISILLVCLIAFPLLHVAHQADIAESYLYPMFVTGLFASLIPVLKDAATPYKGAALTIEPEWWGTELFHFSVLFAMLAIGYVIVYVINKNK